jgi:2-keto-3-deoxy-L-rhamnonate aldolase RhmA
MIKFMLITNVPELAEHAESCGIGRIFIDLEQNGKQERQGHLDTLISQHSLLDIPKVKAALSKTELLVRLNPLYEGTGQEIDEAIAAGADFLMLPMFRTVDEIERFTTLVDGRAGVIPLVETYDAAEVMEAIVCVPGVTEIYIGLNDLHLDMQLKFMFEPLANGLVEHLAEIIKGAGLPFGFGGIARVGEGIIPGELVLGEHLRLGSSSVILSRTFHRKSEDASAVEVNSTLKQELQKLVAAGEFLNLRNLAQVDADQRCLQSAVSEYVAGKVG